MTQNCGRCHTCGSKLRANPESLVESGWCPKCFMSRHYASHGSKPTGDCADKCAHCGAPAETTVRGIPYCQYSAAREMALTGKRGKFLLRCDGRAVAWPDGAPEPASVPVPAKSRPVRHAKPPKAACEVSE